MVRCSSATPSAHVVSASKVIVIGGTGLIGSAVVSRLRESGFPVIALSSTTYPEHVGATAHVVINCNGNSYRFKAAKDPQWDFAASVLSVHKSLFDFTFERYIYISTIDVYDRIDVLSRTVESTSIDTTKLHPYGFHKWVAERLVERFAKHPLILRTGTVIGAAVKKGPLFDLLHDQPLHMSAESELSLIDTETIADAVNQFVSRAPAEPIVNLTGTGSARLHDLCQRAGLKYALAPGAEKVCYKYAVDNTRLSQQFPIRSSYEIGSKFLSGPLNN
jgi:nucleoside-diphosphate-sugar epimerase